LPAAEAVFATDGGAGRRCDAACMDIEKTDQQQFDEAVSTKGKLVVQTLAGVGIVAALMMSVFALLANGNRDSSTMGGTQLAAPAVKTLPANASVAISHITRGCHTLTVAGASSSAPSATIHLAAGGTLHVQNNDVMPHQIVSAGGPQAQLVAAAMNHMGARSTVTFPSAGTYSLTTKAGEDYMKGVMTMGEDNTLKIRVIVA
jgi:plastocyanin